MTVGIVDTTVIVHYFRKYPAVKLLPDSCLEYPPFRHSLKSHELSVCVS
jgi:hypothetical protein